jgi:hypothetical protein
MGIIPDIPNTPRGKEDGAAPMDSFNNLVFEDRKDI